MTARAPRAGLLSVALLLAGCGAAPASRSRPLAAQEPLTHDQLVGLVERISEPGGYFDTDNLISNETGYLKVIDALVRSGPSGGAYVGVGPDQNYSYIAAVHPDIAFITDVRRDNLLHHLLLKALVERAETRVEFLCGLHGVRPPPDPAAWRTRDVDEVVAFVDGAERLGSAELEALQRELERAIDAIGLGLSADDHATIRRFHRAFVDAGPSLRFTTFGRPPRPYYPTYRQLVLETDVDGHQASWLASADAYDVVRRLHLANRIVPVVGDMTGPRALRAMGDAMREMGVELTAFYASNVEFYLWQSRTFDRWIANLASMPAADGALVIRSYFPNAGPAHPSAVAGYYSTQTLQPVATLLEGSFASYWEVVTRGALPLR